MERRQSDKEWDYDKIDEKCVTEEEIAKRNSIFYNHIEINKDKK